MRVIVMHGLLGANRVIDQGRGVPTLMIGVRCGVGPQGLPQWVCHSRSYLDRHATCESMKG